MSIEVAILDLLRADPVVERSLHNAYFPGVARQDTESPYLSYHLLDEDEGYTLNRPDGTPRARLQLDVWSTDPDERRDIGFAVKECLNGVQGWAGPVYAKRIKARLAGDDQEQVVSGADAYWYRRRVEVEADYEQQPAPRNQYADTITRPQFIDLGVTNVTEEGTHKAWFTTPIPHGLYVGALVRLSGFDLYSGDHFVTKIETTTVVLIGLNYIENDTGRMAKAI